MQPSLSRLALSVYPDGTWAHWLRTDSVGHRRRAKQTAVYSARHVNIQTALACSHLITSRLADSTLSFIDLDTAFAKLSQILQGFCVLGGGRSP